METYTLLSEKRDLTIKAKNIRKTGFVPAVVYGHHLDSLSIQIKEDVATKFLRTQYVGSKVLLEIDGEEQLAIFKDFQKSPTGHKIYHIGFHALTSGEKVKVTLPIKYMNKDSIEIDAVLQEQMSEIEISALPKFLIEHVNIDVSKYSLGDTVFVKDLDVFNDENIEVISSQESQVFALVHATKFVEEVPEGEEETNEAAVSTDTVEE